MIRHVVLFRWTEDATPAQVHAVTEGLAALPAQIPEIKRYVFGPDLGLREGTYDFGLVADFADEAAFRTYVDHPAHQELLTQRIGPIVADRVSVQHRLDD